MRLERIGKIIKKNKAKKQSKTYDKVYEMKKIYVEMIWHTNKGHKRIKKIYIAIQIHLV